MVPRLTLCIILLSWIPGLAQIEFDSLASDRKELHFNGTASGDLTLHLSLEAVAVAGNWTRRKDKLVFTPIFPLKEGHAYVLKENGTPVGQIKLPIVVRQAPRVVRIHPGSDTVPANLLKIYIVFDRPMATGHAAEHIQLINHATGKEEAAAFLQLEQELWNYTGDTLTMWLDPGRIKRDLIPNEAMGNPLAEGNSYSLRILSGWPARNGTKLTSDFIREFYVAGMDRTRPDPSLWKIQLMAGDEVKLEFPEPMDLGAFIGNILLMRGEERISYIPEWAADDRSVRLRAQAPLTPGEYRIYIDPVIEDLAGNSLERLFDQEVDTPYPKAMTTRLQFRKY